ncbi:hypothetical protein TSUD_107010 [Trifolium subterraneum]|uniref:F-box domain-containing protein n=1 Tax=Trifolium subterraneum TaxID=3900 RepID=A0A2Z6MA54_TRISU|nr:hypothetical protein TSUD_107010 [Trifolium subterraneum]
MVEGAAVDYYLPDDCWETIFKFLVNNEDDYGDDNNNYHFSTLSTVSKQFLSITNHILFSLIVKPSVTIPDHPLFSLKVSIIGKPSDFLSRLIHRFSNLNSLHLMGNKLDENLRQISSLSFISLKSLHLNCGMCRSPNYFPADGLQLVSRNITTLTSLTCCHVHLRSSHLFLIAECFPLLEQLNLSYPRSWLREQESSLNEGVKALSSSLLKLRKVDLTHHHYINDQSLCYLFMKLEFLEEAIIIGCYQITTNGFASAICERPNLRSLSFSSSDDFDPEFAAISIVCPQIMSLTFTSHPYIEDRGIVLLFASIFPNLQLLDLSGCSYLDEDDICHVLRNCTKIRQLNLANASIMKFRDMNFDVPKLEVLNLSHTKVDDEALNVISKSCRGLLKLLLEDCWDVTEKGVNHVVENCTQLREINLMGCTKVHANVVASMVLSRPSLRRIIPPQPNYCFSDTEMELFSRQRCLVQTALMNLKL